MKQTYDQGNDFVGGIIFNLGDWLGRTTSSTVSVAGDSPSSRSAV